MVDLAQYDWAHRHFPRRRRLEKWRIMRGDHVQICSVLYNTCQFELDEKKIGNASESFGEDFSQKRNLSPREMEKASRNRKSLRSPVLNARALTCYFLTRSLNSWRHVLFNYPYLKYYLNKNLGVFGSDWQSGLLNYKYPPHMPSSKVHVKWNSFLLSFRN